MAFAGGEVMNEIAKKLAAHSRWRWMPGMAGRFVALRGRVGSDGDPLPPGWWPDLDDPATKGWLLVLVREGSEAVKGPSDRGYRWIVVVAFEGGGADVLGGETEGEALAEALLCVWARAEVSL
jgi:hypothetical protein